MLAWVSVAVILTPAEQLLADKLDLLIEDSRLTRQAVQRGSMRITDAEEHIDRLEDFVAGMRLANGSSAPPGGE